MRLASDSLKDREFASFPSSRRGFTRRGPFGHVTFANIWDLGGTRKRVVLVPWGAGATEGGGGGEESDGGEQGEERRDYGGQWESRARGDIGIESVYARQVPERDRGQGKRERDTAKGRGYARQRHRDGRGRARVRWRGASQTVHFANSPTFWFAAMKRHYLQRSLW